MGRCKVIRLRFRKWLYYLVPGGRSWLREVEGVMNSEEVLGEVRRLWEESLDFQTGNAGKCQC